MNVRTLPTDEWHKLHDAPGPLPEWLDGTTPDPDQTIITVIEDDDGAIKGYWVLFNAVHAEPLYLDESIRHHPKMGLALMAAVGDHLRKHDVKAAFGIIGDADVKTVAPMAQRAGFKRLPGTLYAIRLP